MSGDGCFYFGGSDRGRVVDRFWISTMKARDVLSINLSFWFKLLCRWLRKKNRGWWRSKFLGVRLRI